MVAMAQLAKKAANTPYIALITVSESSSRNDDEIRSSLESIADLSMPLVLPFAEILDKMPAFTEIAVKWILNAVSSTLR